MNYGVVSQEQLEQIDKILNEKLIRIGVDCVIIIDMAGNIITAKDGKSGKRCGKPARGRTCRRRRPGDGGRREARQQ